MFGKLWRQAALSISAGLLTATMASADDTIRLVERPSADANADTKRLDLKADDDGDTILTRGGGFHGGGGYHGGGYHGGYGGYRGGYYGGYRGGYYGGYRGGYYGGYRGYYGYGYPRYYGGYYGGYGLGFGLGLGLGYGLGYGYSYPYYSYPNYSYSSYPSYSYSPIYVYPSTVSYAAPVVTTFTPATLAAIPVSSRIVTVSATQTTTMPRIPAEVGTLPTSRTAVPELPRPLPNQGGASKTFPYDGGPTLPVPMPKTEPKTKEVPDRAVSLPAAPQKLTYRAYGEPLDPKPTLVAVKGDRAE